MCGLVAGGFDEFGEWAEDSGEPFASFLEFEDGADRIVETDASFDHLVEGRVAGFMTDALFVEGVDAFGEVATRGVEGFDACVEGLELGFVLLDFGIEQVECFLRVGREELGFADLGVECAEALGEFADALGDGFDATIVALDACDEGCVLAFDACDDGACFVNNLTLLVEIASRGFAFVACFFELRFVGSEVFLEAFEGLGVLADFCIELGASGRGFCEADSLGFDEVCRVFDRFVGHLPALVCGFCLVLCVGQRVLGFAKDTSDRQVVFFGDVARFFRFFESFLRLVAFGFEGCDLRGQSFEASADVVILLESKREALGAVLAVEFFESASFGCLTFDHPQSAFSRVELLAGDGEV